MAVPPHCVDKVNTLCGRGSKLPRHCHGAAPQFFELSRGGREATWISQGKSNLTLTDFPEFLVKFRAENPQRNDFSLGSHSSPAGKSLLGDAP